MTDADYIAAINLLEKRYAKPSVIKRAHMNELLNLAPVYKERNVVRLRALRDQIESHFRSLDALGIAEECYSAIVVPVLMEKIPESLRYNMIRFSDAGSHLDWSVKELIEAFEKELEVRESHAPIFAPQQQQQQHQPKHLKQQHGGGTATDSQLETASLPSENAHKLSCTTEETSQVVIVFQSRFSHSRKPKDREKIH